MTNIQFLTGRSKKSDKDFVSRNGGHGDGILTQIGADPPGVRADLLICRIPKRQASAEAAATRFRPSTR